MMISDNATQFFGKPVVDWTPETADAFNYSRDVPRLRLDWDSAQGSDDLMAKWVETLVARPEAAALEALIFGMWGEHDGTPDAFCKVLAGAADKLPALKALFIGDIISEENEISWIQQGDLSVLWPAFSGLKELRARGGNGLKIGKMDLPELETLIIESGGLPREVVADVLVANLPKLTHLELWLGTEDYGGTNEPDQFENLTLDNMPALRTLALRDSDYADELAKVLVKSPVLNRIKRLDLSLGTLGDEGGYALLNSQAVRLLKELDLHHNYLGEDCHRKLTALGFLGPKVDVSERLPEDEYGRYVAVGE